VDYALVIRALERHCRMTQQAVNFAREQHKGSLYAYSLSTLQEAQRALDHVKRERERDKPKMSSR
jgi:hypothetical protein